MPISGKQRYRRVLILVLLLVVPSVGWLVYSKLGEEAQSFPSLRIQLAMLRDEMERAKDDLEVQRARHDMDRKALELVRQEIATQKERIAELEEALHFYRSLMAPEDVEDGLSLRTPELVQQATPGQYSFRIVIQQVARSHETVRGFLAVEIAGVLQGEDVQYPLDQLSEDMDQGSLELDFLYFQSIGGNLKLPEGFEPKSITVMARTTEPGKMKVREQFPWQLQERFTHVGK